MTSGSAPGNGAGLVQTRSLVTPLPGPRSLEIAARRSILIAKQANWKPLVVEETAELPSLTIAILVVLAMAGVAGGLALLVYRKSQAVPSAEKYSPAARVRADQFGKLNAEVLVDPGQSLRELADREQKSEN